VQFINGDRVVEQRVSGSRDRSGIIGHGLALGRNFSAAEVRRTGNSMPRTRGLERR
jgi:hypothetical protein